eukprot:4298125-Pyramimonas_sp.AAC.1
MPPGDATPRTPTTIDIQNAMSFGWGVACSDSPPTQARGAVRQGGCAILWAPLPRQDHRPPPRGPRPPHGRGTLCRCNLPVRLRPRGRRQRLVPARLRAFPITGTHGPPCLRY